MANCAECKDHQRETAPVPYTVHEGDMARAERSNKRLWIVVILLIAILLATNIGWLYYESQFKDVVTTIEADTSDGGTAIANGEGSVTYNGESEGNNPEACP